MGARSVGGDLMKGISPYQAMWWREKKPHLIMDDNMMRPFIAKVAPKDEFDWVEIPERGDLSISVYGGVIHEVVDKRENLLLLIPHASGDFYSTKWEDAVEISLISEYDTYQQKYVVEKG